MPIITNYLHLKEGVGLYFNKLESPKHIDCAMFGLLFQVGRSSNCKKLIEKTTTKNKTDIRINTGQIWSGKLNNSIESCFSIVVWKTCLICTLILK